MKRIDIDDYEAIMWQNTRFEILNVLYKGIPEKNESGNYIFTRRVLTAQEILKQLNSFMEIKIKKSNLYFHLKELIKLGVLAIIKKKQVKNKYIAYYGRTSKIITPKMIIETFKPFSILENENFSNLLREINKNDKIKDINDITNSLEKINKKGSSVLEEWLDKNNSIIEKYKLDIRDLGYFLQLIYRLDKDILQNIVRLKDLIEI
ncbi:MAG: hypothetical protein ACW967_09505 [Candidatus Hodarchaeales archaeon]|jgi:hypothetical protein